MTFAELERAINSWNRRKEMQAKERASLDYILADLIGYSVARTQHSSNKMPTLWETYPNLFADEAKEKEAEQAISKVELSAIRFRQFANAHNKKIKGGADNE